MPKEGDFMLDYDIYNLLLKDTPFYNSHASYTNLLRKHGIDTVGKLLDNYTITRTTSGNSKEQLEVLISLYKYQYLGNPLGKDRMLKRRIIKLALEPGGYMIYVGDNNYKHYCYNLEDYLEKLLGVPKGSLYGICKKIINDKIVLDEMIQSKDFKVHDLLKLIITYKDEYRGKSGVAIKNIILAYIESYGGNIKNMNMNMSINAKDILKGEIINLIKLKDAIEIKTITLQRELDNLIQEENNEQKRH